MKRINELPKTALKIKGSKDFIDIDGKVYTKVTNYKGKWSGQYTEKTQHIVSGYKYCGIYMDKVGKCVQRRVHRLVAETFIQNLENFPIVGHKNNIKTDNRVENLYWTTYQENSQKAVDDGLLINKKGYEDSQSKPVVMFDTITNKKIAEYGSIIEASNQTGIPKNTIARQAKYHRPVRKPFYFRYVDDETASQNTPVGLFDYDTDKLINTYFSIAEATRQTNSSEKTVSQQCHQGKPKHKFSNKYFSFIQ